MILKTRCGSSWTTEKLLFDDHIIVNSNNITREKTLQNSTTRILNFLKEITEKWLILVKRKFKTAATRVGQLHAVGRQFKTLHKDSQFTAM